MRNERPVRIRLLILSGVIKLANFDTGRAGIKVEGWWGFSTGHIGWRGWRR